MKTILSRLLREIILTGIVLIGIFALCGSTTVLCADKKAPLKVAFVHGAPVGNAGWTWSHDQGRIAVEKAFPGQVKTFMVDSTPFSNEATRTIEQFVADGAQLVIVSSELADFLNKVVDKYPEIKFLEANGHSVSDNKSIYYFKHWNTSYYIGVAAGMLTKSNKLGLISSFATVSAYTHNNAFQLGAQSVNPNVTTQCILLNSWYNPAKATQATNTLIDSGVDFIFGFYDEPSFLLTAEKRNVWAAGCDSDLSEFAPTKYVNSYIADWNDFYLDEVKAILNGDWQGNRRVFLPMELGNWGKNVPASVKEKVQEVRDKVINDCDNLFVGPIKDKNGQVRIPNGLALTPEYLYTQWNWSVEGVSGMPN